MSRHERPTQPRQERAHRTRAHLLKTVETLAAAEGAEAVTTTRVAAETGVAVGTIYRYFDDREAMLLEAYDATVTRIVRRIEAAFEALPQSLGAGEAAVHLLQRYIEAAEAIPAHAALLKAMRAIRPIEAGQAGNNETTIIDDLIAPFLTRYTTAPIDAERLQFMSVMVGTMVDLYLVTPEGAPRVALRAEIEAHVALMVERIFADR